MPRIKSGINCGRNKFKADSMAIGKLGEPLIKILNKKYESSSMLSLRFKRYDLAIKTDSEGRPILFFIGKKDENGKITGDRYVRRLVFDAEGHTVKDHWDYKGKAT